MFQNIARWYRIVRMCGTFPDSCLVFLGATTPDTSSFLNGCGRRFRAKHSSLHSSAPATCVQLTVSQCANARRMTPAHTIAMASPVSAASIPRKVVHRRVGFAEKGPRQRRQRMSAFLGWYRVACVRTGLGSVRQVGSMVTRMLGCANQQRAQGRGCPSNAAVRCETQAQVAGVP